MLSDKKSQTYCCDYTGDESIPVFVSFAIEQYKKYKGISGKEAMETLSEYGILEHLEEFYDVLHLHGHQWLMQEIDSIIQQRQNEIHNI